MASVGQTHAAPHRFRLHRQPDLTIKAIVEDGHGMWLACDQGLYRFTGFLFEREGSYPFKAAHDLAMTQDGSLWIASRMGLVRRHPEGRFEVVQRADVSSVASAGDRVFFQSDTLVELDLQGRRTEWPEIPRGGLLADARGDVHFVDGNFIWRRIGKGSQVAETGRAVGDYEVAVPDTNGKLWVGNDNAATSADPPRRLLRRSSLGRVSRKTPLLPGRDGSVWFLGEKIENLTTGITFRGSPSQDAAPPTAAFEDSAGHLWVARRGLGLMEWIEDDSVERWYPEEFLQDTPQQILRVNSGPVLVARNGLYRLEERGWKHLTDSAQGLYAALALPDGEYIAALITGELMVLSAQGIPKQVVARRQPLDHFVDLVSDIEGKVWASSQSGWSQVTREGTRWKLETAAQATPLGSYNNFDMGRDGVLRVAHSKGVSVLGKDGGWQPVLTETPMPAARFAVASSGERLWMAGMDHKLYRLDRQASGAWSVARVHSPVVYFSFLQTDSRGWVWAGSSVGVFVMDGEHAEPGDWLHLFGRNGVPAEGLPRHGWTEASDGSIWLAGSEGVVRWWPSADWFRNADRGIPRLTRNSEEGGVTAWWLRTSALHDFPYLFRFQPGRGAWQGSRDGRIEAEDIPAGSRRVEVRMTGSPGVAVLDLGVPPGPVPRLWPWLAVLPAGWMLWLALRRTAFARKLLYYAKKRAYLWRLGTESGQPLGEVSILCAGDIVEERYRIVRQISKGGFSRVFEGRGLQSEERVALKILPAVTSEGARVSRDAYLKEVAALRSVDHRGIVRILDSWVSKSGEPCVAMELLEGPTLREELGKGPLEVGRCARVVAEVGETLAVIHARGLVHRDLKPENILLVRRDGEEQPVLIDFGAAGLAAGSGELAASTLLAGSFHYLAPERLSGHYSAASDVYSWGIVILEMLTERRLSDLACVPAEEHFARALEECLEQAVGQAARAFAETLAPAFDPVPRRRPVAVEEWSRELARMLDQTLRPTSEAIH